MINQIISLAYFIGGFKLLFETRKRYNIYMSVGFILYGIHFLLRIFTIEDTIIDFFFNIPHVLGSLCMMMSPLYFLKEGLK